MVSPESLLFVLNKLERRPVFTLLPLGFQCRVGMRIRGATERSVAQIIKRTIRYIEMPYELHRR